MTIFHKIVKGEIPCWKVWEDDAYLAFLTPFPNTPGMAIVVPKNFEGDYIFNMDKTSYMRLMEATQKVAKILEKAFETTRVAVVFEGTGVAYVHAKLYPLHGKLAGETDVWGKQTEFYPEYRGFLSTVEGPKMSDDELKAIQDKILSVQK